MIELLSQPWPWFVAGPLIGLTVALLLLVGGKAFGVSSSLQLPSLIAVLGFFAGGLIATHLLLPLVLGG